MAAHLTVAECQKHTDEMMALSKKKDYDGMMKEYDEHAVLMPNSGPVVIGVDAIRQWYKDHHGKHSVDEFQLSLKVVDVHEEGNIAFIRGTSDVHFKGQHIDHGKYLTVLKKTGNTRKVIYSTWNTDKVPDNWGQKPCETK